MFIKLRVAPLKIAPGCAAAEGACTRRANLMKIRISYDDTLRKRDGCGQDE